MIKSKVILIKIIFIFLSFNLTAQTTDEQKFSEAVKLFKEKKYQTALALFQNISTRENKNQSAASFFVIKTFVELKNFSDAEKEASNFIERFNSSRYADEVYVLLIKSLLEQKKYKSAFEQSVELIRNSKSVSYRIEGKNIAQNIAELYLSSYDIKEFSDKENDEKVKPFLLYVLGKVYLTEGDFNSAEKVFENIIRNYPKSDEYFLAKNSLYSNEKKSASENLVGVLLPLTDKDEQVNVVAQEMLEGLKYAFHELNNSRQEKFGLVIRDTKRDEKLIRKLVEEFESDERIKVVLGPVYSDEAEIVISTVRNSDLAIISPTATDEDLTENNDYFFQANPPFSLRGKVFAQYIFIKEGIRNLAILNSLEGYSPILAKSFSDEFQRLGGNILIRETYRSKSLNVSEQISRLIPYLDRLQGIYIPLSDRADAEIIISELLKQNIILPIYGNQDWINAKGLETSSTLSNNLKITSDFFIDYSDISFKEFSEKFVNITGKDVTRNVLYGYDTARYLTTVLRSVQPSRKIIKLKMESGLRSTGFHKNFSFSKNRRNTFINILKYSDGKFSLIEKYRGTD